MKKLLLLLPVFFASCGTPANEGNTASTSSEIKVTHECSVFDLEKDTEFAVSIKNRDVLTPETSYPLTIEGELMYYQDDLHSKGNTGYSVFLFDNEITNEKDFVIQRVTKSENSVSVDFSASGSSKSMVQLSDYIENILVVCSPKK